MKTLIKKVVWTVACAMGISAAAHAEKVIIGHFGDPAPVHVAIQEGKFKEATGWDIEWRKFASGAEVIAAMASGDVQLSDLGSSPLSIAVSQGVDIKLFLISFLIGESESLIVRNGSGIETHSDLKGKRIAVPLGSTAHLSLTGAMKHWGISPKQAKIIGMPPEQINAAWAQNSIDAAFVWNPVQSVLLKNGKRLVSAGEVAKWGYPTFNGWVVNTRFAKQHEKALVSFAKVVNEVNADYLKNKSTLTADSDFVKKIAQATGANDDQVVAILEGFQFLTAVEQVSWMESDSASAMKKTADFLKETGRIDQALANYSPFVDSASAKEAAK